MDKHLFLVRHAQAETEAAVHRDFERELSSSGVIEACRVGSHLKQLQVMPDVIITSPAHRALSTAQYMAEQIGYDVEKLVVEPLLYQEFALQSFIQMINEFPKEHNSAMIVAHNPKQSYLAEYLTHEDIGVMPTCGVVHIVFENQPWSAVTGGSGKLVWFEHPEKIMNDRMSSD